MNSPRPHRALAALPLLLLTGCAHNPSLNVLGSYFPGWILCIFVASLMVLAVRYWLRLKQLEYQLAPLILIYPALAVLFCLTLWLILFGVR